LLQSTASDTALGRFDLLLAFPGRQLIADERRATGGFLNALDSWWQSERISATDSRLPFHGGWFIYLGYELADEIEPTLQLREDPLLPRAFAVRCPAAVIRDHSNAKNYVVCESMSANFLETLIGDVASLRPGSASVPTEASASGEVVEEDEVLFLAAVQRAKQHIAAGDIFQTNLSRGWSAVTKLSSSEVYERLAAANPAPFAGSAKWRDKWIISSSPERLLEIRDRIASTRPIAGTRPRATELDQDQYLSAELIAHPKERAEHVMLIDLERNDLGRICEAGSVEVNEMMILESYAHVHHIVSNVRGRLRRDVTPGMAMRAVFPGGTITGCPKVRCMEIIGELESTPRGAYTGSFGYLNRDGSLDLNILIRTMIMNGSSIQLRAGAGIVADSEATAELAETRAKAKGLLEALT